MVSLPNNPRVNELVQPINATPHLRLVVDGTDGPPASARTRSNASDPNLVKILIADDDPKVLLALQRILAPLGVTVLTAVDAYSAIEQAVRHEPQIMMLDIEMPAGSGFNVQERFENILPHRSARVIYMADETSAELRRLVARYTDLPLVRKPLDPYLAVQPVLDALDELRRPAVRDAA